MHVDAGVCVIGGVEEDVVVEIGEETPELMGLEVKLGSDEEEAWDGLGSLEGDVTLANSRICKVSILSHTPPTSCLLTIPWLQKWHPVHGL